MKVYAEFKEEDGLQFRTKTLLQFGDSWDLIGSIVMKNPGSAKPSDVIDEQTKKSISKFYNKEIDSKNWFVSNGDSTINRIKPIFNGEYVGINIELSGVIQVFNILNICDSKIESAIKKANTTQSEYLFPNMEKTIQLFGDRPVYLGFFDFYTDKTSNHVEFMCNFANRLFDHVKNSDFMYLPHNDIIDNPMYHPFSRQISGERSLPILKNFISLYVNN